MTETSTAPRRRRRRGLGVLAAVALLVAVALWTSGVIGPGGSGSGGKPPPAAGSGGASVRPSQADSALPAGIAGQPCGRSATAPASYDHVVWIVMENKTWAQVIGSPDAPYTTALAGRCATATHYADAGHFPSLPSYIAMTSGATNGFTGDVKPQSLTTPADNIFRQVRASGRRAVSYAESMPSNCYQSNSGRFAVRHVPAIYYVGADDVAACRSDVVPLGTPTAGAFADDLRADRLPAFSFITPDVVDDGHDGASLQAKVAASDGFLSTWLPMVLESPAYAGGRTAVVVTWDEDTPTPNVWIAPSIRPGATTTESGHYSLLRTTEEMLGLPYLGAAATAPSMRSPFTL
jgi:Phosphoesterase family